MPRLLDQSGDNEIVMHTVGTAGRRDNGPIFSATNSPMVICSLMLHA